MQFRLQFTPFLRSSLARWQTPRPQPQRIAPQPSHASTHARVSVHPPRVVAHGGGSVSAGPPAAATTGPFEPAHEIAAMIPDEHEDAAGIQGTAQVQVTPRER